MKFVRTIITSIAEGVIKRYSGTGRPEESFTNREYFQHYGFTSRPLNGSEGIVIMEGNKIYLIASDDRRYRIAVENGEVCLYTDEGDFIHFKRGNLLHVNTGNKLLVDATNEVEINAPDVTVNCENITVNASVKATVTTPFLEINSATSIKGISPIVQLGLSEGLQKIVTEAFLTLYNTHTHNGGHVPDQQAGAAHKTVNVTAT